MNAFDPNNVILGIGMPGPAELILILVIVLVVFGHNRIPQLGEALGKGIKNFKKSFDKEETEVQPDSVQVTPVSQSEASTTSDVVAEKQKSEV
jgi:sec-independent protein translocase protein TatA